MKNIKIDLMVDAVHYSENGHIDYVRGYQKRGTSFSDNILIPREDLVALLKDGKTVVSGTRKHLLGSTFDVQTQFTLSGQFVTNKAGASSDLLENVPLI